MEDDELRRSDQRREEWEQFEEDDSEGAEPMRRALLGAQTGDAPSEKTLIVSLPTRLHERFEAACNEADRPPAEIVVQLVETYVERNEA